jgi:hypothetical protein
MITQEWEVLLVCILCGMLSMFFYDALRVFRNLIVHRAWLISLEDICYWILVALFFSWLIFRYNNGSLRAFLFIGFSLGTIVVNWGISRWSVPFCTKLLSIPLRFLKWILVRFRRLIHKLSQKISKKSC